MKRMTVLLPNPITPRPTTNYKLSDGDVGPVAAAAMVLVPLLKKIRARAISIPI